MNENANQLYDLISNIQTKLNNENNSNKQQSTYEETITPDNNDNNTKSESTDNDSKTSNSGFDFSNFDINTILKMQNLFSKFSKNSPKKDLLYSLKPFLNEDRQNTLSEYITIMSIIDALDLFNKKGSDNNV